MGTGEVKPVPTPSTDPGDLAKFFGDQTQYKTVEDVAKKVGADDGRRKAFVWISGGNNMPTEEFKGPVDAVGPSAMSMGPGDFALMGLARLLDAMRKSNVAGYPIATGDFGGRLLNKVAEETGGFVMLARDFDRDLDRLVEDLDHYYMLGFYPADPKDKSYHPLEVRITTPGLTVRARKGYQADSTPAPPKNKTDLARMAANVLPRTDLPLRFFAEPNVKTKLGGSGVDLTLEVRADRTALADPDGLFRDTVKYEIWAVDLDKKKATKTVAREAKVVLSPRDLVYSPPGEVIYQVQTSLAIPPGHYQLRASATSARVNKGGSVYLETNMPAFPKTRWRSAASWSDTRRVSRRSAAALSTTRSRTRPSGPRSIALSAGQRSFASSATSTGQRAPTSTSSCNWWRWMARSQKSTSASSRADRPRVSTSRCRCRRCRQAATCCSRDRRQRHDERSTRDWVGGEVTANRPAG